MTPEQLARHEAGHAAAVILLGCDVHLVSVVPDDTSLGICHHNIDGFADGVSRVQRMIVILCGLIESAETADDLPEWPLTPDDHPPGSDHHTLAVLAQGLTRSEYGSVMVMALRLSSRPDFQRLVTGITGLLDYRPVLDRDHIAALTRRL